MGRKEGTKTVFRLLLAWNDREEERWLTEQEHGGWHLRDVRWFGYTFERETPRDMAYRLDFGPSARRDRQEYFGLFRDAGWEHVGTRGFFHFFRKAVLDGQVPEIYTDSESRIAMYRRVVAFGALMLGFMVMQMAHLATESISTLHAAIFFIQALLAAVFAYSIVRLLLVIGRLKRLQKRSA